MKLIIGNKNYSSWSLRAWLAVRLTGASFEEILIPLDTPEFSEQVRRYSAAARVPVLLDGDIAIWDSLAIIEYLAEKFPDCGLWPEDTTMRALARSCVCEMHSGFSGLRSQFPMNLRRAPAPHPQGADASADLARIAAMWRDLRARRVEGGDFLFGRFSAADCFYAPVVTRLLTFKLPLDEVSRAYCEAMMAHSFMKEWREAALEETWIVSADEVE